MNALESLAHDVPYLGHSASLTRCRFVRGSTEDLPGSPAPSLRRVYPGRLAELEEAHRANPDRPTIPPGASVIPPPVPERGDRGQEWLVLELVEGRPPDLRAAALVCRLIRVCLMSGYRAAGMSDGIPELISGHTEDGRPTRNPHLAIVPLAFTGSQYADGKLHGVALIPPRSTRIADLPGFRSAFMRVATYEAERERRVLTVAGSPLREPLQFSPAAESTKWSLSPLAYRRASRIWGTVTPIVLDRHLKRRGPEEVQRIIAASCRSAGLPEPDTDRVQIGRHSCFEGAPPAGPQRGGPPWTRWRVPESFATRSLFHAVIDFGEEVEGPVLLGAGRFVGPRSLPSPAELSMELTHLHFAEYFRAVHGHAPFPWQERLVELLAHSDEWPDRSRPSNGLGEDSGPGCRCFPPRSSRQQATTRFDPHRSRRGPAPCRGRRVRTGDQNCPGAPSAGGTDNRPRIGRRSWSPAPATGWRERSSSGRRPAARRSTAGTRMGSHADPADHPLLDRRPGGFPSPVPWLWRIELDASRPCRPAR